MAWAGKDLGTVFDDLAGIHNGEFVADRTRQLQIMCDDQHTQFPAQFYFLQVIINYRAGKLIQTFGRFVC